MDAIMVVMMMVVIMPMSVIAMIMAMAMVMVMMPVPIVFLGGVVSIGLFVQPALHISGFGFWVIKTRSKQSTGFNFAVKHAELVRAWIDLIEPFIQR